MSIKKVYSVMYFSKFPPPPCQKKNNNDNDTKSNANAECLPVEKLKEIQCVES